MFDRVLNTLLSAILKVNLKRMFQVNKFTVLPSASDEGTLLYYSEKMMYSIEFKAARFEKLSINSF